MTTVEATGAVRSVTRLGRFTMTMFRPHVYATYGVLWTLAAEGTGTVLSGTGPGWSPSLATACRAVTVVSTLLFLRMADEQKDLAYDRVHHPDRPLVTGAITATELRAAMTAITAAVAAVNALVSPVSTVLALLPLGYGLVLVVLEHRSRRIRDGLLLNLCVTYPVQILIGLYLYYSPASTGVLRADWRVVPLLGVFAGIFLHFEFARKTRRGGGAEERLYSNVLGSTGSAVAALALGSGAVLLEVLLVHPWTHPRGGPLFAVLAAVAAALPALGAWRFLARGRQAWPLAPAMGFVVGCHGLLIVQAAVIA